MNGGGSPKVVHTLGGGLAKGVLGVYKGGGWVKKGQNLAYVLCTQPLCAKVLIRSRKTEDLDFVLLNVQRYVFVRTTEAQK